MMLIHLNGCIYILVVYMMDMKSEQDLVDYSYMFHILEN